MAFRHQRRRFTRRGGARRSVRWTAQSLNLTSTTVAGGQLSFSATTDAFIAIALPGDIRQSATLEPDGATVVRVVGQYNISAAFSGTTTTTPIPISVFCGIIMLDALTLTNANVPSPAGATALIDNDWLWVDRQDILSGGTQTNAGNAAQAPRIEVPNYRFDVRSKRKMFGNRTLIFCMDAALAGNSGTQVISVAAIGYARVLLQGLF